LKDLYIKTKDEAQAKAAFFHRLNEELSLTLHVKFKEVDLVKFTQTYYF